jgi:dynactin 1
LIQRGAVDDKELQELRAKVRILETKREEEARHIQQLETKIAEAERFIAMKPKLQTKLQQQQTDLIEARRELADALNLAERTETRVLDAQEQLEMAALDKEVAEERAEAAELELEELKEKLATMEVEVDVARGGGGESKVENLVHALTQPDVKVVKTAMVIRQSRPRCNIYSSRSRMSA